MSMLPWRDALLRFCSVRMTQISWSVSKQLFGSAHLIGIVQWSRLYPHKVRNECFCSSDYLWLLPRRCLPWFLSAYHEFVRHSGRKGHVWRLVLFQNTIKTYAWCISCQLQPYLNSSATVAISHPTVIYRWLLSRSAFGERNKEKTTRWVCAQIIVEHWTLLSVCWILPLNETFCFHNLVK